MRKLFLKLILLATLVGAIMAVIIGFDYFVIGSQYKLSYQAALVDKVERLESINEPKIILAGNSNLAFGIRSDLIEEAMGMPVVNLGFQGDFGNALHEQVARLNINAGDIVVVSHTYYSDNDSAINARFVWTTYDNNNSLLPIFRPRDYIDLLPAYPAFLRTSYWLWATGTGNRAPGNVYARSSFNEYGDIVVRCPEDQTDIEELFDTYPVVVPKINSTCINRLNELNQYCIDRGATMVVAAYPVAYGDRSTFTENDFEEFQNELASLLDCEVISDFTDYFFPYNYFYNTDLHLTDEGAIARTNQLIADLEAWQANLD